MFESRVLETSETVDRRCTKSRKAIINAFTALIEERGIDGFTVSDITEYADMSRCTFYSHYKDKDDLLMSCESELLDGLSGVEAKLSEVSIESVIDAVVDDKPLPAAVELYRFLKKNCSLFHALMGSGGDIAFEGRLRESVCKTLVNSILAPKYSENPTPLVEYYVSYMASAHMGVLQRWLERGMTESPEEMSRIIVAIMFMKPGDAISIGREDSAAMSLDGMKADDAASSVGGDIR